MPYLKIWEPRKTLPYGTRMGKMETPGRRMWPQSLTSIAWRSLKFDDTSQGYSGTSCTCRHGNDMLLLYFCRQLPKYLNWSVAGISDSLRSRMGVVCSESLIAHTFLVPHIYYVLQKETLDGLIIYNRGWQPKNRIRRLQLQIEIMSIIYVWRKLRLFTLSVILGRGRMCIHSLAPYN